MGLQVAFIFRFTHFSSSAVCPALRAGHPEDAADVGRREQARASPRR